MEHYSLDSPWQPKPLINLTPVTPTLTPTSTPASADTCVDCVTECTEPLCPSAEVVVTSQCTDRCVVIACDDPDHATEMACHEDSEHLQCDFICDGANNCVDCTGLDEFVSSSLVHLLTCVTNSRVRHTSFCVVRIITLTLPTRRATPQYRLLMTSTVLQHGIPASNRCYVSVGNQV